MPRLLCDHRDLCDHRPLAVPVQQRRLTVLLLKC
jgi:hypothetical protein